MTIHKIHNSKKNIKLKRQVSLKLTNCDHSYPWGNVCYIERHYCEPIAKALNN